MFVKPAPGLKVADPKTKRHLPPEGREVEPSTYWHRRIACGDVTVATTAETVLETSGQISDSSAEK